MIGVGDVFGTLGFVCLEVLLLRLRDDVLPLVDLRRSTVVALLVVCLVAGLVPTVVGLPSFR